MSFRCGSWSCSTCGPAKAASVRRGLLEACRVHGLTEMLTLTLDAGHRGKTSVESRTVLSRLWNAMRTRLRKTAICAVSSCRTTWTRKPSRPTCPSCGSDVFRSFLKEYVAVWEAHADGYPHLHVACNLDGLLVAERYDYGAVRTRLAQAWPGGFLDYSAPRARGQGGADEAARYLSKYLGKAQAGGKRPPWEDLRWCTEDGVFRVRPWHRYMASRLAGRTISPPRTQETRLDLVSVGGAVWVVPRPVWRLARAEVLVSGRVRALPWNPAEGSAIMDECDGHPPTPEWVPGSCHHGGGLAHLGACMCVPPWADEPVWSPPLLDLADLEYEYRIRTIHDLLAEYREAHRFNVSLERARTWWAR